jgi:integrase/recombinase XerD
MTRATVTFSSPLTPSLKRYVDLKRALAQRFYIQTRTLVSLDRFLYDHALNYPDLNAAAFRAWCQTQEHVASGVRRVRMQQVHNFCLYRRRTEPHCFVPDPALFPKHHQRLQPYIFSEQEVARLLRAASAVKRLPSSPLRPDVIRLAIVLLFTTGIRRGELQRLALGDYNRRDATLLIRETKFYKSRLLPLNSNIAEELERAPGLNGDFLSLQTRPSCGMPSKVDGLTTAPRWRVGWSHCSGNAPSLPLSSDCHASMIFVTMYPA